MKNSDLLQKARQRLLDYGWQQGTLGDCSGPVCAMGAIYWSVAKPYSSDGFSAKEKAYLFIRNLVVGDDAYFGLGSWNDQPHRTKKEVLQAFDDAISLAMSEESLENV